VVVDQGASINLASLEGKRTALQVACHKGSRDIGALLLASGAELTLCEDGRTLLMLASYDGFTEIVELLVAHGCGDLDLEAPDGKTSCTLRASVGGRDVVRVLLGAGADLHLVDVMATLPS
jgi:ankyrin repeat protein